MIFVYYLTYILINFLSMIFLSFHFTYLGNNTSSTENDVNITITRTWMGIDRLPNIWNYDLLDKIKLGFLQNSGRLSIILWLHHMYLKEVLWEKARWELHKDAASLAD